MDRLARQEAIVEILSSMWISNQEDLQKALDEKGFDTTQATLSRDLRSLQVIKSHHPEKGARYIMPDDPDNDYVFNSVPDHLDGVISVEFSGQFAVIRTIPGFANSVAYTIDRQRIGEILGTIAGDDTILVILREGTSKNLIAGIMTSRFPSMSKRLL